MKFKFIVLIVTAMLSLVGWNFAQAQGQVEDGSAFLRKQWDSTVAGKRIVFIPVADSSRLPHDWGILLAKEAKDLGIKYEMRDPDFDANREVQIIASLIPQKPDVLIVHNPNPTVLVNVLKQAEKAGIYVIQVNMGSNYPTDAYVGINVLEDGVRMGQRVVDECNADGGSEHKVALMAGEVTSAYSAGIMKGILSVLDKHKNFSVVSNQAASWQSQKANNIATTVLQAHKDLCAYAGVWSGQDVGIAQAVKQAGLLGKVKVITTGGAIEPDCQYIKEGLFSDYFNYQYALQANQMMATAKFLLQTGMKPGTFHATIFTPVSLVTKANLTPTTCVVPS